MYPLLFLALACLITPVFAKYAGYEYNKKPFDIMGVSGIWFLLAFAFTTGFWGEAGWLLGLGWALNIICQSLGWIWLLIGSIWAVTVSPFIRMKEKEA